MDIRNTKPSLQAHIRRFTLKATASTILTLNAETAMANIVCPLEILGNLPGICNFSENSSVTVANGGTVGGINMSTYQPTNSYIMVDAGGTVSGTSSNNTISITNSLLTNGLSNNGTISSAAGGGIFISSTSTISGGISNSGLISTHLLDIEIRDSTINGNIFNSGTIASTVGTGISLVASTLNGNILNSGSIIAGSVDEGITISSNTNIQGNILNSGLIRSDNGNGIIMRDSTINGDISNSGVISAHDFGIEIFNTFTIQGDIANSGTITSASQDGLRIHNGSLITGGVSNSGLISGGMNGISIFSATTINGGISNSGSVHGGATGISISSSATMTGGISNSGTIQGDIFAIHIANDSHVDSIDILGKTARIVGAVDAAGTDMNITNGAVFTSEGAYSVNQFNIATNAFFNMANSITANSVNNTGTLAITDSLQIIAGNYVQNMGGVFQTGISSATNYGQLSVTGTADLLQSGNIYVQVQDNASFHAGDIFSNVISGSSLITPTSGFRVDDNSFIWEFITTLNDNTGVNLTAEINPIAYIVCQDAYCQGAADAIIGQVAEGNPIFSPYAALPTENAFRVAASQATPELTNENIQTIQLITRAVVDIVPMWSSLRGKSSGDAMIYQPGKIWVKPYGASMTQDERNTVNGFNATAYGAVIGKDIELSQDVFFGGAFAAGGDNMHGKSVLNGQSINSSAYQGMLYGAQKFPNQIYFAGQGLVGYELNNTRRAIPLYTSTAKGSYNSWFTNIRAETGWSKQVTHDFVFTPEMDASYVFINQSSYQETGSPMDLLVTGNNNSSLVLGVYGNGAYHLTSINNNNDLTLTAYAGIAGDVINSQPQTLATFVASGSSFTTFGVQFSGIVFRGGAGLTLTSQTQPLIVELNYDLQAGNSAYSGIGAATIKYKL